LIKVYIKAKSYETGRNVLCVTDFVLGSQRYFPI